MHQALLSFNAGEVTPYLRHRMDIEKAASAAETMENFLPMPYGGAIKRPGLQWLKALGAATQNSRLFPFLASSGQRYLIHCTPGTLTVYAPDGTVKDTLPFMTGYPWPATHDWQTTIRDLQMVQINDVAFLTHPGTFPLRLSRLADTDWSLEFIPFERAPTIDENLDKTQTYTVASNPVAAGWVDGQGYAAGAKVFTNCEWQCLATHTAGTASRPGTGANWRTYWRRMFYRPGDAITLLADERSTTLWSLLPESYGVGDVRWSAAIGAPNPFVLDESSIWLCLVAHTEIASSELNLPSGVGWVTPLAADEQWVHVWAWAEIAASMNFVLGQWVYKDGTIYECIAIHDKGDPLTDPGDDGGLYWSEYGAFSAPPALWWQYREIQLGERRANGGRVFECIQTHRTTFASEPGVGNDWDDYWSEVSRMRESFAADAFGPGIHYRISPERDDQDFQVELAATSANSGQASPVLIVQGAWNFYTYGTWTGTFTLERSANRGASWETVRAWESKADRNVADSGTEDEPVWLRLKWQHGANGSSDPRGVLVPESPYVTGYCLMDTYVGPDRMTGTAKTSLMSGNTWRWAEGAFNSKYGYPRALALHESRLAFAGTAARPVSLWLSATDDLLNFEPGIEADDAIFATLALTNASPIRWLASQRRLFIGTAHGEWVTGSETSDQPMSPTNFLARQYSAYGTAPIPPHIANDAVLFLERKGSRLRELAYHDARGSYDAADLTRLAEHMTVAGISNMAWQATREPMLWVILRDGGLRAFAWNRRENIAAWSRITSSGGSFLDVAVIPSDAGDDEVFFITERGGNFHLERFPQHWQAAQEQNAGWLALDGIQGHGTTLALPAHLRTTGITRVVDPYGNPLESVQNYTGATTDTLPSAAAWQLGRPVAAALIGLPIDTQSQTGTTQARRKRQHKIVLSLIHSRGGEVWNREATRKQRIPNTQPHAGSLRSGWEDTIPDPGHRDDCQLRLTHADPFPFCLRAAVIRWQLPEP